MAFATPRPLPLPPDKGKQLAATLNLSTQQTCMVELILLNCRDKQIAVEMHLKLSTVRIHLSRIFKRLNIEDRMSLVLMLFAASHKTPITRHRK